MREDLLCLTPHEAQTRGHPPGREGDAKNGPETSGLKNDRWIPFLRDEEKAIVVLQGNEV